MNTQHLLYALEVARFGSYSRASQSLEIGQPTLSKAVSELEKTLGITIFQRSARGVVPTEEGKEFLRLAGETLKQIRRMESLHRSGAGREALWISIPPSAYILEAVTDFLSELDPAETIDVRVREATAKEVAQDVAEGRSRLGVLRCPPARERFFQDLAAEQQLETVFLWEFDLRRTCAKSSPLLANDALPNALEVSLFEDSPIQVRDRAAAYALLRANPRLFCMAAPMSAEILAREGLGQIAVSGHRRKDFLIFPQGHRLTDLERRWVDRLFAAKNKLAFTN